MYDLDRTGIVQAEAPGARLVRLQAPPVVGGVVLGMAQAGLPATKTYFAPVLYWCGLSKVARSRKERGSKTTRSAIVSGLT